MAKRPKYPDAFTMAMLVLAHGYKTFKLRPRRAKPSPSGPDPEREPWPATLPTATDQEAVEAQAARVVRDAQRTVAKRDKIRKAKRR